MILLLCECRIPNAKMGGLLAQRCSSCSDREGGGDARGRRRIVETCSGRIPCNGAVKRVPGGVVCVEGLASEGVLVIWSHR